MRMILSVLLVALSVALFAPEVSALPGCDASEGPGCGGCFCEACVCLQDSYCCETAWDSICVSECLEDCGGCEMPASCGDGDCNSDEFENCGNCLDDCGCAEGEDCINLVCCATDCDGKECGADGCGGFCGECGAGEYCTEESACEPIPPCAVHAALHCDDVLELDTAAGINVFGSYNCSGWDENGPELGFSFDSEVEDLVVVTVEETGEADHDIFLMEETCLPDQCIDYSGSSIEFTALPASHYFLVVDGYGDDVGPLTLSVWCQSTCEPECGEESACQDDGCLGTCPCADPEAVCFGGECCIATCEGKVCGDDGCGGDCGDCVGVCVDNLVCMDGPGCATSPGPTCDGCGCEDCVCEMDSFCCETAWDSLCVSECVNQCGGCLTLETCGDGACVLEDKETCSTCPEDCACPDGESCYKNACCTTQCEAGMGCQDDGCGGICPCEFDEEVCWDGACCVAACEAGMGCQSDGCGGICTCDSEDEVCYGGECCVPSCEDKECGSDGCGGTCGQCPVGQSCDESNLCFEPSCEGACGGNSDFACYCDDVCFEYGDCCNDVCEFCPEMEWCADLSNCGDGTCDAGVGEECENCSEDCACEGGDVCGLFNSGYGCILDMCAMGAGAVGCCQDGVNYICIEGETSALDCSTIEDSMCGWYVGDESFTPGYYCGPPELIDLGGDPSGEYAMECPTCDPPCGDGEECVGGECVVCVPACDGKNCGADGCGGECGECPEGLVCQDGMCATIGCQPMETPGCGGCPCEECVCEMDPYCCDTMWDNLCADACVDSCDGCPAPDPFCGDLACNADEDCESCAKDCGCEAEQVCDAGECVDCVPSCDGLDCGDDGCGGNCGDCGDEEECVDGLCVGPCDPDCIDKSCGDDGCDGSCGDCGDGEQCVDGACEAAGLCGNGAIDAGEECEIDDDCGVGAVCTECVCITACPPDCVDKVCGDDGCGDSCGTCAAEENCEEFLCVPAAVVDVITGADLGGEADLQSADSADNADVTEDTPKKDSSSCSTAGQGNAASLLLIAMAALMMLAWRRRTRAWTCP